MFNYATQQLLQIPHPVIQGPEPSGNPSVPTDCIRDGIKSLLPLDLTNRLTTSRQINLADLNAGNLKAIKSDLIELSAYCKTEDIAVKVLHLDANIKKHVSKDCCTWFSGHHHGGNEQQVGELLQLLKCMESQSPRSVRKVKIALFVCLSPL